jgi:hypothetical protein
VYSIPVLHYCKERPETLLFLKTNATYVSQQKTVASHTLFQPV